MSKHGVHIIPISEVKRFVYECLTALGTLDDIAEAQASLIIEADQRGQITQGMAKLEMYMNDIKTGLCDPKAKPEIIKENDSTALVNGNNGLGAYTGIFCMEKAIEKAKQTGVGWVACKNCNFNGIQSFYSLIAIRKGLIGFTFTNSSPYLVPTRAKTSALGINPICMGVPAKGRDYFLMNMNTTATSFEKIEFYKKNKLPLPIDWARDENGHSTTNADYASTSPNLTPLGGTEENGGYKGTGLAILVEVLCGISSGSKYGLHIEKIEERQNPANYGQCYIAVDPEKFTTDFKDRMSDFLEYIRQMPPADPAKPVMIPGDQERKNKRHVTNKGGIVYSPEQLECCNKFATKYGIEPLKDITGFLTGPGGAGGYGCSGPCAKQKNF